MLFYIRMSMILDGRWFTANYQKRSHRLRKPEFQIYEFLNRLAFSDYFFRITNDERFVINITNAILMTNFLIHIYSILFKTVQIDCEFKNSVCI